jgi:hypothetical protein
MKKQKHKIIIEKDGWVIVRIRTPFGENCVGLGDLGVDVVIVDRRKPPLIK